MVYKTNSPAANDDLDVSQVDIQQNFLTANTVMAVNHYPFDNVSGNQGKHKFVEMPVGVLPIGLAAGEANLYSKTANGESQLFFTPDLSGNEYQLTRSLSASFGTFSNNPGWCFLPGGLLMQWGTQAGQSAATIPVTFPVAFTGTVYNVQIIPIRAATSPGSDFSTCIVTGTKTTTGFTIGNVGAHTMAGWDWVAIGK